MQPLQVGALGSFLLFVVVPAVALGAAIALSAYEVYRIGERKLLVVIAILALMLQHQLLEAYAFLGSGGGAAEGVGEAFETGANLIASGSVYYVLRFTRRERRLVRDLERSERQYRNLIEESPVPVLLCGADEVRYANDAAVEMFDAEAQSEVVGQGLPTFLAGENSERVRETVLTDGGSDVVEGRLRTLNGRTRHTVLTGAPADYEGEDVRQVVVRDITERRRREREFEQIFNGVHDQISVFDPESYEMVAVNDRMCEVTGYDRERILSERNLLSVREEGYDYSRAKELIDEVAETGEPRELEWRIETADGDRRTQEVRATLVSISGEDRVVTVSRDVTERKRREREYEQIYNGVQDGLQIMDPDTLEILDVNEAYLEMFGYDSIEAIREQGVRGLSVTEEGFTFEQGKEIHQRVVETGEPEILEWQAETADGERIWLELKVTPAVVGGEQRTIVVHRDITNRKRRERIVRELHDSTDDLQDAPTDRAVCEAAVEAAADVLDLSLPACWLDDDGTLEPVAVADADRERSDGPTAVDPGSVAYEVFQGESLVTLDPRERDDPAPFEYAQPFERAFLVPLGEHGLLGAVATAGQPYDELTLDALRILARHTRSALDRVERARELRESERRFRTIAERIDQVIYLADAETMDLLYINPAYGDIWDRPVEELYEDPMAFTSAIHPADIESFRADREAMIADIEAGDPADSYEFSYRIERPDGELRWIETTGYPIVDDADHPDRYVAMVADVTERHRREQRLDVFNRILRHNLRNQLDVISGHAEVLADTTDSNHARRIIESTERLGELGNRARVIDRLMSRELQRSRVDLSELLQDRIDAVGGSSHGPEVTVDRPEAAPLVTDRELVAAVLQGALDAACTYAESTVWVTLEADTQGYTVEVDDNGPGLPPGELAPLEAETEMDLQHSRGLGLWQVKWGVEKLNGEFAFDVPDGPSLRVTVPDLSAGDED